jgi:hypothetical protein
MSANARVMVTAAGQCHVYGQGQAIEAAVMGALLRIAAPSDTVEVMPTTVEDVALAENALGEHVANDHGGDADQCHVRIYRHDTTAPDDTIGTVQLSDAERETFQRYAQG